MKRFKIIIQNENLLIQKDRKEKNYIIFEKSPNGLYYQVSQIYDNIIYALIKYLKLNYILNKRR